jgi:predicted DNA-binding transcriptional regulator AlpA
MEATMPANSKEGKQMLYNIGDQNHFLHAMEACIRISKKSGGRGVKLANELTRLNVHISDDMPEAGGGGASAKDITTESTSPSESDSKSGDDESEPDPVILRKRSFARPPKETSASPEALLWALPTLCQRIGMSRSNIYQQIQAGKFPEPLKLGRSSRWLATEIHAWVNAQACARTPQTAG